VHMPFKRFSDVAETYFDKYEFITDFDDEKGNDGVVGQPLLNISTEKEIVCFLHAQDTVFCSTWR
jgi:hypothetical protein